MKIWNSKPALTIVYSMFLSLLVCMPGYTKPADYNFVSIEGLIEQEVGRVILPQVYKKMGKEITITPLPGVRAQVMATSGKKDGEIMRIWTYGENDSTVIRVPTPYYSLETMCFVKKGSGITVNSKEDLSKYRVAKVRGVKHTDNITKGMPASQVYTLNSTGQSMRFVMRGRADIALTNTKDGLMIIQKFGFTDLEPLAKPLAVLNLFNYIHESKADIVPEVDATLKAMKESGELDELIKKAEKTVIEQYTK
jgi:polar amino acid transport system substrate-binding protein